FRHPLGIPIPHTALIREKKDSVGEALSDFVGENFLNAELITDKVSQANLPEKLGTWLSQQANAEKVAREAGRLTANAVRALDPKDAELLIQSQLIDKLAEPQWGPPLGKLLAGLIEDGKVEPVVNEIIDWSHKKVLTMEDSVVTLIDERMPNWAPRFARSLVGERVYKELVSWVTDVKSDDEHEARQAIRRGLKNFAADLQSDPELIARVESLKSDIMGSTPVEGAAEAIWAKAAEAIIDQAETTDSMLRQKIVELCLKWGTNIVEDRSCVSLWINASKVLQDFWLITMRPRSPASSRRPLSAGMQTKPQTKSSSWWAKTYSSFASMARLSVRLPDWLSIRSTTCFLASKVFRLKNIGSVK